MILEVTRKHRVVTGWLKSTEQQGITQNPYQNVPSHTCSLTDASRAGFLFKKEQKPGIF